MNSNGLRWLIDIVGPRYCTHYWSPVGNEATRIHTTHKKLLAAFLEHRKDSIHTTTESKMVTDSRQKKHMK